MFTCPSYIDLFGTNTYTHVLLLLHGTRFLFVPLHIDDCIFECLDCKVKFVLLQNGFSTPSHVQIIFAPIWQFHIFHYFLFFQNAPKYNKYKNVSIGMLLTDGFGVEMDENMNKSYVGRI